MTELTLFLYLRYLRDTQWMIEAYNYYLWHYGWVE